MSLCPPLCSQTISNKLVFSPLKKPGLDPTVPHNYRPISKLPLSKKIEKAVTKKLLETVETNNILDPFQSGCRMLMNADSGHHSILVFLDLSVTF